MYLHNHIFFSAVLEPAHFLGFRGTFYFVDKNKGRNQLVFLYHVFNIVCQQNNLLFYSEVKIF